MKNITTLLKDRDMEWMAFYFLNSLNSGWTSKTRVKSKKDQPHIERSLLIGSQGSWPRAHTVVHHLLPQVMDFGLKTPILCKTRIEWIMTDSQVCIQTPSSWERGDQPNDAAKTAPYSVKNHLLELLIILSTVKLKLMIIKKDVHSKCGTGRTFTLFKYFHVCSRYAAYL